MNDEDNENHSYGFHHRQSNRYTVVFHPNQDHLVYPFSLFPLSISIAHSDPSHNVPSLMHSVDILMYQNPGQLEPRHILDFSKHHDMLDVD